MTCSNGFENLSIVAIFVVFAWVVVRLLSDRRPR